MDKTILLISPKVGDFHLDIISEMKRQGYYVDYIDDVSDRNDPDYLRGGYSGDYESGKRIVLERYKQYWENLLSNEKFSKKYDFLFVIDGRRLHPYLFDTLRKRNPSIKTINYLYDTTRSLYRFDKNFKYFDKVVTFDREDSLTYGLDLMPIPWTNINQVYPQRFAFFALGSYIPSRYELFMFIKNVAVEKSLPYYLSIFKAKISLFPLKYLVNILLGRKNYISPKVYYSKDVTHSFITKDEFTKLMYQSEIIVDSIDERQDGLTARCTWALGAEKKIITNNKSIASYDFYTPDQIFIVSDYSDKTKSELLDFFYSKYTMCGDVRGKIAKFRIDNWVSSLLTFHE